MADLEYFFDPVCPFAWVTSRWVKEVQRLCDYDVRWRFISLMIINENRDSDWYTPEYRAGHVRGTMGLRIADQIRLTAGDDANEQIDRWYTTLGTMIHTERRRAEFAADPHAFLELALKTADLDPSLVDHATDESHDAYLRQETETAFSRTGDDVGTPILTFFPDDEAKSSSFFGPVISKAPRGQQAVDLWNAVQVLAATPSLAELKRSLRSPLDFT
jgi:hypothetical protein